MLREVLEDEIAVFFGTTRVMNVFTLFICLNIMYVIDSCGKFNSDLSSDQLENKCIRSI